MLVPHRPRVHPAVEGVLDHADPLEIFRRAPRPTDLALRRRGIPRIAADVAAPAAVTVLSASTQTVGSVGALLLARGSDGTLRVRLTTQSGELRIKFLV